jgi:hypothetical protein
MGRHRRAKDKPLTEEMADPTALQKVKGPRFTKPTAGPRERRAPKVEVMSPEMSLEYWTAMGRSPIPITDELIDELVASQGMRASDLLEARAAGAFYNRANKGLLFPPEIDR